GQPLHEYAARLGSKMSTTSRHFMDLAERNRRKGDGHKLIERRDNPLNEREKLTTLSAQGKLMRRAVGAGDTWGLTPVSFAPGPIRPELRSRRLGESHVP